MQSQDFETAIVGGGLAGLATAAYLAKNGRRVIVLERSKTLGGRAQTQEKDGFNFNFGPHALFRHAHGMQVLEELGVPHSGGIPKTSGGYALNKGRKHILPGGPLTMLTTGLFRPAEKLEAIKALNMLPNLSPDELADVSIGDWVERSFRGRTVKNYFLAFSRVTTYCHAPELLSAGEVVRQLQHVLKNGVLYLDGGWNTLIEGLRRVAESHGAVVRPGANVAAVERDESGAVTGIRLTDGERIPARAVVVAASPNVAADLVRTGRKTVLDTWADEATPIKVACLDIALEKLPNPKAIFALGIDAPTYFSVHSAAAKLGPEHGALIHVAKYLAPNNQTDSKRTRAELEAVMDTLQPGWRNVLVHQRFFGETVASNWLPTARTRGTLGRPGPSVPDVRGLFVVGDWVGREGHLADASLASARAAAREIERELTKASDSPASLASLAAK